MCQRNARLLGRGRGEVPVVVEPGLPHGDDPRVRGEPLDLGEVGVGDGRPCASGAARPRRPPARPTSTAATTQRAEARSSATVTARVTPTAAALSIAAASSSGVVAPHASRCVWASIADASDGDGSGFTGDRAVAGERARVARGHRAIGAHSGPVSPSFGSSLVKIGVGLASGRPTSIGVDAHRACSPA